MALGHSPSIVRTGLVFYYDMNNTQKSWRGKPTTNLVNPLWSAWTIDGSGQGSIGTRTILSSYHCRIDDVNQNTRQSIYISGVSANTSYTFSVKYKKIFGTPTLRFQIQAYNGETFISGMTFATTAQLGITDIDDWQTASITLTTPSSTTRVVWFMQDGDDYVTYTHSFELKEPQMEEGSIASSFVNGTRSSTQSLLDITGNNTITANSLTYNANGTFSFNGTTNYTRCTANCNLTGDITLSAWIKNTYSGSGPHKTVICTDTNYRYGVKLMTYKNYPRYGLWLGFDTSDYEALTVADINDNANKMLTGTWNQSTGDVKLYVNGTLTTTINTGQTSSIALADGVITTGAEYFSIGNTGFDGSIYNAQIYNRALSDQEVLQNFNAHRDIYGL